MIFNKGTVGDICRHAFDMLKGKEFKRGAAAVEVNFFINNLPKDFPKFKENIEKLFKN